MTELPRRYIIRLSTNKDTTKDYIDEMLDRLCNDSDKNGYPIEAEIQYIEDID